MFKTFRNPLFSLFGAGLILFVSCQSPESVVLKKQLNADTELAHNFVNGIENYSSDKGAIYPFEIREYSKEHQFITAKISTEISKLEDPYHMIAEAKKFETDILSLSMPDNDKEDLLTKILILELSLEKIIELAAASNKKSISKRDGGGWCAAAIGGLSIALFAAQEVATVGAATLWAAGWVLATAGAVKTCHDWVKSKNDKPKE